MNALDIVLLLAIAYSALRGFRQGAVSQIAAFGGAMVGLGLGAALAPRIAGSIVSGGPGSSLALGTLGLLMLFVFIGQGVGFGVGMRLRAAAAHIGAEPVDRTAGVVVGLAGLIATVWLLGAALSQGPSVVVAQQIRESQVVTTIDQALPPAPDIFAQLGRYLDQHGFPQVFSGLGGGTTAPPVDPPSSAAVAAAQAAGQPSTVQVQATGCGGISSGTGWVTRPGFVVSNAHVVAGGELVTVRDASGTHDAAVIHFDPDLDLAVLAVPTLGAPPIGWASTPADRGVEGATLGFPGGQRELAVKPATVRDRGEALGRDIYGRGLASREILTLAANVQQGDSGGPFVTAAGEVGGVVFAASPHEPGVGYALTAERVRPDVDAAIGRNSSVPTGACRY
ncbi:MAG TPA: MarP family serine protease [Egibacteraceae bacterium]|nr:MarP family serine protease [Egibacteraceae bacterium]